MILKECGAAKGDFQKLWHTHLLKASIIVFFVVCKSKTVLRKIILKIKIINTKNNCLMIIICSVCFLQYSDQISFRQQGSTNSSCHLYSFKEGINTLCRLQVPQEFYFTPRHFKELFIRSGKVIPFFEAS